MIGAGDNENAPLPRKPRCHEGRILHSYRESIQPTSARWTAGNHRPTNPKRSLNVERLRGVGLVRRTYRLIVNCGRGRVIYVGSGE